MIKKRQRYQWSDKAGVLEALSNGDSSTKFKVVQAWPGVSIGYSNHWNVHETYAGCKLILLEGQEAPA